MQKYERTPVKLSSLSISLVQEEHADMAFFEGQSVSVAALLAARTC